MLRSILGDTGYDTTKQNTIIDLPRQRFGEYNYVSELKIWDRLTGGQAQVLLVLLRN